MSVVKAGKATIYYCLFLMICFHTSVAVAVPALTIDENMEFTNVSSYLEIYRTHDKALDIEQISDISRNTLFDPVTSQELNLAYSNDRVWLRLNVQNKQNHPVQIFLESGFSRLDKVSSYIQSDNGEWLSQWGGDAFPYDQRPVKTQQLTFPLLIPGNSIRTIYLSIESTSSLHIPLYLTSAKGMLEASEKRYLFDGLFYGICLTVFLAALFISLLIRQSIFIFYTMHVALVALSMMALDGSGYSYWPNSLKFQEISIVIFQCLQSIFVILFARTYLNLAEVLPRADIINKAFMIYSGLVMLATPFIPYKFASLSIVVPEMIMIFWVFGQSIYRSFQRYLPAYVLTMAWGAFFVVIAFLTVANLGIVHDYADSIYSMKLALLAEFSILLLGLGFRLHIMRKDQEQNRSAAIIAQAENNAKSETLAKVSHEIRTPLNGIIGVTELLQGSKLDPKQQKYLETIRDSGESLLQILNDILDHSKLEAGKLQLENIEFDLRSLLLKIENIFSPMCQNKGIKLVFNIKNSVPTNIVSDPIRIRQVIVNLLGNAVKFTSTGTVTLSVSTKFAASLTPLLVFEVEDTGRGIDALDSHQLFDSFSQGDTSVTRNFGGSGLGLSICKQLVEIMNGQIGYNSVVGSGSLFWFSVPAISDSSFFTSSSSQPLNHESMKIKKILVAEDVDSNWLTLSNLLAGSDIETRRSRNGIEVVESFTGDFQPDLILMDCQMPAMNGYEATQEIRLYEEINNLPRTPIIALTSEKSHTSRKACMEAGMDDFVSKPINQETLGLILNR